MSATRETATVTNRLSPGQFVRGVRTVAGRELAAYFDSPIAYVVTAVAVALANFMFMNRFFLTGTVDMTLYFDWVPALLVVFLPAISMRLWAEERRLRTIELLLSLPITPLQAVLAKYTAALGLFTLFLVGSLPIPIMLGVLGDPDLGLIFAGYLGVVLLSGLFLAAGMLMSALVTDQIVAFVLSAFVAAVFLLTGWNWLVEILDGWSPGLAAGTAMAETISAIPHYDGFVRGVVEPASIVYFVGLSAVFLWITGLLVERNRA